MTGAPIRADRLRASESLYGAHRAQRPSDLGGDTIVCPFCPGNESRTGALLSADAGVDWTSRVIANLFPAVIEPQGRHEVIVEMREHDVAWDALDRDSIERILGVYRQRESAGYADGYAFVAIFKNSGSAAGASLAHPHAQVVALRSIPLSIAARLERLTPHCDVCETLRSGAARIVATSGTAVAYIPDGARIAYEVRIASREHGPRFSNCADSVTRDIAATVSDVLRRLAATLGEGLPFNMIVQSAPREARAQSLLHWEIELVPRLENFGGFEVGTGGFLVSRAPEDAAAILRAADSAVHA